MPINYRIRLGRPFDPPEDVRVFTAEMEQYFARELAAATLAHEALPKPARPQQGTAPNLANRT